MFKNSKLRDLLLDMKGITTDNPASLSEHTYKAWVDRNQHILGTLKSR